MLRTPCTHSFFLCRYRLVPLPVWWQVRTTLLVALNLTAFTEARFHNVKADITVMQPYLAGQSKKRSSQFLCALL